MTPGEELEKLLSLMARLRSPDGCPWDREQTMSSLRPFILEEAYELIEAIHRGEPDAIREELGDLLLEVVFVNQIAEEERLFEMSNVIRTIHDKLVRRHPHVFRTAAEKAASPDEALQRWEEVKEREKPRSASLLDGVARALPALARAQKISQRAARAGFDWSSSDEVRAKLDEEVRELESAVASGDRSAVAEELGDVLFVLVNLARHLEVDAEVSLARATEKFADRFRFVERSLEAEGRSVPEATMDELEGLWVKAKKNQ